MEIRVKNQGSAIKTNEIVWICMKFKTSLQKCVNFWNIKCSKEIWQIVFPFFSFLGYIVDCPVQNWRPLSTWSASGTTSRLPSKGRVCKKMSCEDLAIFFFKSCKYLPYYVNIGHLGLKLLFYIKFLKLIIIGFFYV